MRSANRWIAILLALLALALSGLIKSVSAPSSVKAQGAVHAVLFWTPGCTYCAKVMKEVIPPLERKWGRNFDMQQVTLDSTEEVEALLSSAASFQRPRQEVTVPFIVIGSQTLSGADEIAERLPRLVETGVYSGGVPAPVLPETLAALARP